MIHNHNGSDDICEFKMDTMVDENYESDENDAVADNGSNDTGSISLTATVSASLADTKDDWNINRRRKSGRKGNTKTKKKINRSKRLTLVAKSAMAKAVATEKAVQEIAAAATTAGKQFVQRYRLHKFYLLIYSF